MLCPLNTGFESESLKLSEITILGRINKVVKEL
jgi:hypothetical protein